MLGAPAICGQDPLASSPVAPPPWVEERRRLIVWDNQAHPDVRAYLDRYWDQQRGFRAAARAWVRADVPGLSAFPPASFVPGVRPRHLDQNGPGGVMLEQ